MLQSQRGQRVALTTRLYLISWPCRDEYTGSLYPVPPESSRRERFCSRCLAPICIFGGTPAQRRLGRRRRHWSLPDREGLEVYLGALRLYTRLLTAGRTCWRCAHLRRLRGAGDCYACAYMAAQGDGGEGGPGTITAWQAQLSTALEGCGEAAFQERQRGIPSVTPAEWAALVEGRRREGCCAWCAHLDRFVVAGRERFVCECEAEGLTGPDRWRLGRSWKVMRARRGEATWCRGALWEQALEDKETTLLVGR